jgi:hypothetical protein
MAAELRRLTPSQEHAPVHSADLITAALPADFRLVGSRALEADSTVEDSMAAVGGINRSQTAGCEIF